MEKYQYSEQGRAVLEGMKQPIAVYQFIDKRVCTLILSDGFCELFGYDDREKAYYDMDNDMYKDTHPDDVARIADAAFRFATEGGSYDVIYRTKIKGAEGYRIIHARGQHVFTDTGDRLAHVWYQDEGAYSDASVVRGPELTDVLKNALHEESLKRANYFDHLTGLPSMTYFFELAEEADKKAFSEGKRLVFLFLDLSGMKFFNHKYGFSEGDKYLQKFARLLGDIFGNECSCHLGQDHFGVVTEEEGLEDVLRDLFKRNAELNEGESLPVRVGIFMSKTGDVPVSTACDRAKIACDAIRGAYTSQFNYYEKELGDETARKQTILTCFDKALKEGWIKVHYQPIIRAVNGKVCDEEALSRWNDPQLGMMSPAEFIPVIEEAGLIYKLDLYVLDHVLEKMRVQMEQGLNVVPISLNLSRSDFDSCDIVEEIRKRVDATDIPRSKITIEITESIIGADFEFIKQQIGRFKELGFIVWLDDFGSGYSSMEILQSIDFDLVKFDMSFMRRLDEGEKGKIILAELVRMANALGLDTLCEGVETEQQRIFLREIGCSKLQGFYFCKPITFEEILTRYRTGTQIGFENPEEAGYFETMGRLNLYDLSGIASREEYTLQNTFNNTPMGIMEIQPQEETVEYVRANRSFGDFMIRFFGLDIFLKGKHIIKSPASLGASFEDLVEQCRGIENRLFVDEQMPDGSIAHFLIRKLGVNPVTGKTAIAMAVVSMTDLDEGATYAAIARALAADYYNIYYVDLDRDTYIEYSSTVGKEELAAERRGEHFFESAKKETMVRIYEEDREFFLEEFSKETVLKRIDEQGVFTITYRLVDTGVPVYANMKIMRMSSGSNKLIIGISIIDAQMKQKELMERIQREETAYARIKALAGEYLIMYTVDPETDEYIEYTTTDEFDSLNIAKEGHDFFGQSIENGKRVIFKDDYPNYAKSLVKENVLREIEEKGIFMMKYHLLINDELQPVVLKIAPVKERDGEKLIAGVRAWKPRG